MTPLCNWMEWNPWQDVLAGLATEYLHTEWQWPLSDVHSIMMVNQPSLVRGGGARLPPFTLFTITYKVVVYAPAPAGRYTPPCFSSIPICTLWVWQHRENWRQPNNLMMASLTFPNVQLYNTFVQPFNFRKLYINRIKCKLRIYNLFTETEL
jgi:hypothetical protein